MAESCTEKKEDSLEDSLSSEEWTIIDQKESKVDNVSKEETQTENCQVPKETVIIENISKLKDSNSEVEHVEEGEEAGENDIESDDVSILSDESESEHVVEEGRIEKIEWRVERQPDETRALVANTSVDESSSPHALISSTCLIGSLIVVTFAIVIAGRLAHFQGEVANYPGNVDIAEKLKELAAIEDKLKELSDVKQALDQIRLSMPEMKKLKDQLTHQKNEKIKFKYSLEDYKNFENLNKQNIFNSNIQDDRLEMLEATYTNFCSIMKKVNSSSSDVEADTCRTPKVLSDMITFKKNLKQAFKNTQDKVMPEKRMFVDAGRKLDLISESLLSEFTTMFARFSFKMQERLNRFGYKLHQRLCLLNDFEKSDDKFLNVLLDDDFFINNCNATVHPVIADYRSNTSNSKKSGHRGIKKNTTDMPKAVEKNEYKNDKEYKKVKHAKKDYTNTSEGESFNDIAHMKIKGEMKYDNWNKKNHEKEEHRLGDDKYEKSGKFDKRDKNDNKYKRGPNGEFKKSVEREESNREKNIEIDDKSNKRDYKYDPQHGYKTGHDYDGREFERKKEYNVDSKLLPDSEHRKFDDGRIEGKGDRDYHYEDLINKKKIKYDDTNDDSKFIIRMDNEDKFENNNQGKQKYKNKEYVLKPENFKESKYAKYDKHERRDRKDKYPNGEWQMQRGKAREKERNSDWYFVRADSRQKARINDEDEVEKEEKAWKSSPPNKRNRDTNSYSRDKPDSFRRRVLRKFGRTWDVLNKKIRNIF